VSIQAPSGAGREGGAAGENSTTTTAGQGEVRAVVPTEGAKGQLKFAQSHPDPHLQPGQKKLHFSTTPPAGVGAPEVEAGRTATSGTAKCRAAARAGEDHPKGAGGTGLQSVDEQRGPETQASPLQPGNPVAARHRFQHLYKSQSVGRLSSHSWLVGKVLRPDGILKR